MYIDIRQRNDKPKELRGHVDYRFISYSGAYTN